MKSNILRVLAVVVAGGWLHGTASAETVGYIKVDHPANTDIYVSIPFTPDAEDSFTVTNVVGGTGLDVAGPLTAGQFDGLFYVRMTSGAAKGQWSTISTNTTTRFNLATTGFLATVVNGDTFDVFSHHTLATIFPDGFEGVTFNASTSIAQRLTEVLIPSTAAGINKSASDTYYFREVGGEGAWRRFGSSPTVVFDDVIIPPQSYFILRNNTATAMTFYALGDVHVGALVSRLPVQTVQSDTAQTAGNAAPTTLGSLQLGGTSAFETSVDDTTGGRRDQLLLFSNTTTGINKSPSATYYYLNGAWRKVGSSSLLSFDADVVPAGGALLIRKHQAVAAGTVDWTQSLFN